jgi:membrane protease YdiL (CAAX protease family)
LSGISLEIVVLGLGLFGLIILANVLVLRQNDTLNLLFHVLLFFLNVPIFVAGLIFLVLPPEFLAQFFVPNASPFGNTQALGIILMVMAFWGFLVAFRPVRNLIARLIPLDATSPVHSLALLLTGYLIGNTALTLSQGGLDGLAETAEPVAIGFVVLSELLFAIVALLGVGFLIRRRGGRLLERLGLETPQPLHWLAGVVLIGALVVFQAVAGLIWALLNPDQTELLDTINSLLLQNVDTAWEWFLLALAAGVGEELLFRGALQPVLGLGLTSVLFALIHVQYGFTPFLLVVLILAVVLGLIRRYFSTTIAIFVHVGYDFVLGLLVLLASFLERFVS